MAALSTSGQTIWIRAGDVDVGLDPEATLGLTLEPAPSALPVVYARGSVLLMARPAVGPQTEVVVVGGFTAAPGDFLVELNGTGIFDLTVHDLVQQAGACVGYGGTSTSPTAVSTITIRDSLFGSAEQPLDDAVLWADKRTDVHLSVEGVTGHTLGTLLFFQCNGGDYGSFSIEGSVLQAHSGISKVLSVDDYFSGCEVDIDVNASILQGTSDSIGFNGEHEGTLTVSNSILVGPNNNGGSEGIESDAGFTGLIQNSLIAGFGSGLAWEDGSGLQIVNSIISHNRLGFEALSGTPSPLTVQYSAFFNNSTADSDVTLAASNLFGCDAHDFQPAINEDLAPLDFLAACAIDSGNPSPIYNDPDGTRNDLGPTGGPGGADFLALFDLDGDGYAGSSDCDDTEPSVHVGALEVCDGHDTDCDGAPSPEELDADADGYLLCTAAGDLAPGLLGGDDCDDTAPTVHPSSPEVCDGLDNDCDSSLGIDETDADGDGYLVCAAQPPLAPGLLGGDDCDDADLATFPGAPELCDGLDNDCDPATSAPGGEEDVDADSEGAPLIDSEGNNGRSVMPLFGVGPMLRFASPIYGFVGLLLQLSPDSWGLLGSPFLAGAAITGGVEIPFGESPLGLRLSGEVGNLHASITVRGMGGCSCASESDRAVERRRAVRACTEISVSHRNIGARKKWRVLPPPSESAHHQRR